MNSISFKSLISAVLFWAIVGVAFFVSTHNTFAGQIAVKSPGQENVVYSYQFFASSTNASTIATTTSATSTNITAFADTNGRIDDGALPIAGAKKVNMIFSRGDTSGQGNSGSSRFSVQVQSNGTDWVDYADLRQVVATSTTAINRVGSITLAGTSTAIVSLETLGFQKLRCVVVEITDGEHTCLASAQF